MHGFVQSLSVSWPFLLAALLVGIAAGWRARSNVEGR